MSAEAKRHRDGTARLHGSELLEKLHEQSEWYSDGHGDLHKDAAAEIERLRRALHEIIFLDHHNMSPEGRATKIARAAITDTAVENTQPVVAD